MASFNRIKNQAVKPFLRLQTVSLKARMGDSLWPLEWSWQRADSRTCNPADKPLQCKEGCTKSILRYNTISRLFIYYASYLNNLNTRGSKQPRFACSSYPSTISLHSTGAPTLWSSLWHSSGLTGTSTFFLHWGHQRWVQLCSSLLLMSWHLTLPRWSHPN